ncbi:NADH-quinone oxidoreductase subunit NuoE family protein [Hydrogenothermus marinus]|uniref:NADH-quinone oxidoreductase subunit E n=1 Tax=Hydrogenothermus marinus TaxID=133270 RepID=A0A3M0BK97_9AQUI|nr:NAD(P)H-dependent oxidoreductase subunit E [Hydrogenothermus marinus]RMA97883.1 NADH-quinone oxidoreductase subunit E [Hydrogenothermus marinus]
MEYKYLTQEIKNKIDYFKNKYLVKEQAIIPSLHVILEVYRDIPHEAVRELSEYLQVPEADIEGIVSFYDMFRHKKNARHHIRLCRNLPCHLAGSKKFLKILEKLTGAKAGEHSPDGKWYIELVECIGSCAIAPAFLINNDLYDGSKIKTEQDLKEILDRYE